MSVIIKNLLIKVITNEQIDEDEFYLSVKLVSVIIIAKILIMSLNFG